MPSTKLGHWDEDWRKRQFMHWLLTIPAEREQNRNELAETLGVTVRTLHKWEHDPEFRTAQAQLANETISPERTKHVLDTLYATATDRKDRQHVNAAKLFLEASDAIKPKAIEVISKPADLTDAELDALLAQGAAELRAEGLRPPTGAPTLLRTAEGLTGPSPATDESNVGDVGTSDSE